MAMIGLKYPVAAKYSASGTTVSYTEGRVLGKAISISTTVNSTDVKLYADDDIAEQVQEFSNGTCSINIDDADDEVSAWLLGHDKAEDGDLVNKYTDIAPYVGMGFYGRRRKDNAESYRAIWYTKVMFKDPGDALTTKGENIEFQTPTFEGTLSRAADGIWRRTKTFTTEAEACEWLNKLAGITEDNQ